MLTHQLIAENIRRFRRERELSLGELARRTGISKQTLSKIEAGDANPTIGTLESICSGMGISLRSALATYGSNVRLQRAGEASWKDHPAGAEWNMDRVYGTGYVETSMYEVQALTDVSIAPHSRGTIHQIYVVSGRVRVAGEFDAVDLGQGDFFRFPGDITHRYQALESTALVHVTTTAPQVSQFNPEG